MKLSRTVAYALQATLQLAESNSNGPVPCSKLAAEGLMPERFLLQILRSLVNQGILQSTRGVDGGYSLTKSADEISLLDVIEAIEGPLSTEIPHGHGLDPRSKARLHAALCDVTNGARSRLGAVKLSQIVQRQPVETG